MTDPTAAEICAHVVDHESLPSTVHGRENEVGEYQAGRQVTTSEKWLEAPDKIRAEVLTVDEWEDIETELNALNPFDTMSFGGVGSFFVQNGAKALNYNNAQNTSKIYDFDSAEGVSVMTTELVETVVGETFDVSTEGEATVADHDCYVLSSTPTDSANALSSRIDTYLLWVDQEYGYPLKQEFEYQLQEGTLVVQRWFEEIEFDSEIPDDVFDCTPPEDSTVSE
jgi:outer membrane lipoprotein-sorting protein